MGNNDVVVVTGATGQVGRKAVKKLLAGGHTVRAVSRSAEKLAQLEAQGASVRQGSLLDRDFLTGAFRGASVGLAVVPQHDLGIEHPFKQFIENAVNIKEAVRATGVSHVVTVSSWGAEVPGAGTGPVLALHVLEELLEGIDGLNVVHLRPGHFMEDRLWDIPVIAQAGFLGHMIKPDTPLPYVATRDIAEVAAELLANPNFSGHSVRYVLAPRDHTIVETAQIIGAAIGKPDLAYVELPEADYRQGLAGLGATPNAIDIYIEMVKGWSDGTFAVEARSAANTGPTTLEEWAEQEFAPAFASAAADAMTAARDESRTRTAVGGA